MARDIKDQRELAKRERLQDEWANVGLCGGMFRPANNGSRVPALPPGQAAAAPNHVNADDWQPHNRCCP